MQEPEKGTVLLVREYPYPVPCLWINLTDITYYEEQLSLKAHSHQEEVDAKVKISFDVCRFCMIFFAFARYEGAPS